MKSIILCEGHDDSWFIAYYLHKVASWDICEVPKEHWKNYEVMKQSSKQQVQYMKKGQDSVAIWDVDGKSSFEKPFKICLEKYVIDYPNDPVNSIVIVRDRDDESEEDILNLIQSWIPNKVALKNRAITNIALPNDDGPDVYTQVTPLIIPFLGEGAIESLLLNSIAESSAGGQKIVDSAKTYVDQLSRTPAVTTKYLLHDRMILKAKYSAAIAITNPDHSTGLFRDMVLASPWQESEDVQTHFDVIVNAITST